MKIENCCKLFIIIIFLYQLGTGNHNKYYTQKVLDGTHTDVTAKYFNHDIEATMYMLHLSTL